MPNVRSQWVLGLVDMVLVDVGPRTFLTIFSKKERVERWSAS